MNSSSVAHQPLTQSSCHVFVVFGAQQVLAVQTVVANGVIDPADRKMCLIFNPDLVSGVPPECENVRFSARGVLAYVGSMLRFKRVVKQLRDRHRDVRFYIPHPFYYPGNYVLFSITGARKYLIPDGTLNYYSHDVRVRERFTMALRWLVGKALRLPYHPYTGHLTAYQSGAYDGVMTFSERGLVTTHQNLVRLALPPALGVRASDDRQRTCLFLDHYLEPQHRHLRPSLEDAVARYIRSRAFHRVYIKRHPLHRTPCLYASEENAVEVQSDAPVELLVNELGPSEVISVYTSALVTIADLFPDSVCVAVGLELLEHDGEIRELRRFFEERGIRIIPAQLSSNDLAKEGV